MAVQQLVWRCTLLLLISTIQLCLSAPTTRPPRTPCKPCPRGYGVEVACTDIEDTFCIPCPHGTYSPDLSATARCEPCSRCGEHLFELHACNATNDVFCELCEWLAVPENKDYQHKCVNTDNTDGSGAEDRQSVEQNIHVPKEKGTSKDEGSNGNKPSNKDVGGHMQAAREVQPTPTGPAATGSGNRHNETDTGASTDYPSVSPAGLALTIFTVGSVFFGIGFFFSNRGGKQHAPPKAPQKDGYKLMDPPQEEKTEIYKGTPPLMGRRLSMFNEDDEEDLKVPLTQAHKTGRFQSPVDIDPEEADVDVILEKHPLKYNYTPERSRTLSNTGHTVRVDFDGPPSTLEGGPLGDTVFCLDHYHFHWGASNERGSEHTIKGHRFAAELHIVHWNNKVYKTFEEASKSENGLAVLAVLVEVGNNEHPYMKVITDLLPEIRYKNAKSDIPGTGFDPTLLLPENKNDYWTYMGSLTTPPYYETVTWIVFKEPIQITIQQMDTFRNLLTIQPGEEHLLDDTGDNGRLVDNFRTTLPLEDRAIKASFC